METSNLSFISFYDIYMHNNAFISFKTFKNRKQMMKKL